MPLPRHQRQPRMLLFSRFRKSKEEDLRGVASEEDLSPPLVGRVVPTGIVDVAGAAKWQALFLGLPKAIDAALAPLRPAWTRVELTQLKGLSDQVCTL